jgi:hypothetical protein
VTAILILLLVIINIRGIKEPISFLAPIGFAGLAMIFLRAYSPGGGTYTGIEPGRTLNSTLADSLYGG